MGGCCSNPETKYVIEQKYGGVQCDQVIIGSTKLVEVQKERMGSNIHKNVVAIIWRSQQHQVGRGSGLLISRDLVLTCAHNFYHFKTRVKDSLFSIYPGQYGKLDNPYKIQACYIPDQYAKAPKNKTVRYDYALVKLTEEVPSDNFLPLYGYFEDVSQKLAIYGYPEEKYNNFDEEQNIEEVNQWGLKVKKAVFEINQPQGEIIHLISTLPGQSGSAIIDLSKKVPCVIGIHKGGKKTIVDGKNREFNAGKLLSGNLISKLAQKAKQMKAQMFNIQNQNKVENPTIIQNQSMLSWVQPYAEQKNRKSSQVGFFDQYNIQKEVNLNHSFTSKKPKRKLSTILKKSQTLNLEKSLGLRKEKSEIDLKQEIDFLAQQNANLQKQLAQYKAKQKSQTSSPAKLTKIKTKDEQSPIPKTKPQQMKTMKLIFTQKYFKDIVKKLKKVNQQEKKTITQLLLTKTVPRM